MSQDPNIGDPSTAETRLSSTFEFFIEKMIAKIVKWVADRRPIDALLRKVDPETAVLLGNGVPAAIGYAASFLPSSAFKSDERAVYVRSLINEAGKEIGKAIQAKGGVENITNEDAEKAIEDAVKKIDEKQLCLDEYGHLHFPDCGAFLVAQASKPKPRQYRKKGQPEQPDLPYTTIPFKSALDQGLEGAPCCFKRIKDEEEKRAKKAKAKAAAKLRPNASPLDVLGVVDEDLRRQASEWLGSLTKAKRQQVMDALHELDSVEELIGLMALPEKVRMEMLPLLENRKTRKKLRDYLGVIGTLIKAGFTKAADAAKALWRGYKQFDDSFVARNTALQARLKQPRRRRPRRDMFRLW